MIDSDATPGGCFVHHSAVLMDGFRELHAGDEVAFEFERGDQDGFAFRATVAWVGPRRPDPPVAIEDSPAYRSTLTITYDEQ